MAETYRFSYDELAKPLDEVQKVHNETLADMANLSANSEILNSYLDPTRDSVAFNMYNDFKKELDYNVDDFAKYGLTRNNGTKLLKLHRNYNDRIQNIMKAVTNRESERNEQHKIQQAAKGQAVFSRDADYTSVDDYLQGNVGYAQNNLDDMREEAKIFAEAASKRHTNSNYEQKMFGNEYWKQFDSYGYNYKEAYGILKRLSDKFAREYQSKYPEEEKEDHLGFINEMWNTLKERNIDKFSPEDQGRMIEAYLSGIDQGLIYNEKVSPHATAATMAKGATKISVKTGGGNESPKSDTVFSENEFTVNLTDKNAEDKRNRLTKLLDGIDTNPALSIDENGAVRWADFETYLAQSGKSWEEINEIINMPPNQKYWYKQDYFNARWDIEDTLSECTGIGDKGTVRNLLNEPVTGFKESIEYLIKKYTPRKKTSYEMNIKPESNGTVIAKALSRGGSEIFTGLQFDPDKDEYSYSGKLDKKEVLELFDKDPNILKGTIIELVDAPTNNSIFQVKFTSSEINNGEPFYMTLTAVGSMTAKHLCEEMYNAYTNQKLLMDSLEKDDSEKGRTLYEHLRNNVEYDLKYMLQTANDHMAYSVKPYERDENDFYEKQRKAKEALAKARQSQTNK